MLSLYLSMLDEPESNKRLTDIYLENKAWMLRLANSILRNEEQAKDAVHNVFLETVKLFRKSPKKASEISKPFLYVAVKNSCFSLVKDTQRTQVISADKFLNLGSYENVEHIVETRDAYKQLMNFISSMPEIYSDVLVLKYIYYLSINEIAAIVKVSSTTVRTRLKRGKKIITKRFGGIL